MFRWQRFHLVFTMYGLLVSISAFITAYALFLIPADPRNVLFLGLSLQRLVMLGGVSLAGILLAVFAIKSYSDAPWSERMRLALFGRGWFAAGIRWGAGIILISGVIVSCLPLYRFGDFQGYFIRIFPLVVWLTFISSLTFVIACAEKYGFHWAYFLETLHAQKKTLSIAIISTITFALIWIFIAKTGLGLWVGDGYWYGAGVPVLGLQIVFAFAIGMGVLFLERSSFSVYLPSRSDLLVFFIIWGITAFLWSREPLRPNFFSPGPYPLDNEYHPYSDAATFDLGSQFALIGQGINNGVFFDRALYMAFLAFLHALVGQNYIQVVALQSAIYAVLPAILYLLGKAVYGRSFGSILAILIILRGLNGIAAGSMINLANQKQLLTDFPTLVFVAWFALMMVGWLKAPAKNYLYILWAGGIIGLAIMLRTNTLFLLLFALLLSAIVYWRQKMRAVLLGFLVALTMFASTFAWGIHNDKSIFDIYIYRILIVIEARYPQPVTPVPAPQGSESPSPNLTSRSQGVAALSASSFETGINAPVQLASLARPSVNAGNGNAEIKPVPVFVAIHFLHNIITSVLVLPTTFEFHDLRHTLKGEAPFWQSDWAGNLTFGAGFFLTLSLLLVALGIGTGWKSARLSGLVPLGIFLFYNLANAFARTSGGRYIVPMDWVVLFYFVLGLFQIILWGMTLFGFKDERDAQNISTTQNGIGDTSWTWQPLKKAPWIILIFLFIGTTLPLSEQFFPRRYSLQTEDKLLTLLEQEGYLQKMGFDRSALNALSDQRSAFRVVNGRAMYPRYFWENEGVRENRIPYSVMGFPRIAFTMIGPYGENSVILPQGEVFYFPNASDVIVIGCQEGEYLDALAVVVIEDQTVVYVRQPVSPLQCPLPQPVCNENRVCQ
jgi:hypothetical protein